MLERAAFGVFLLALAAMIGPGAWTLAGWIEARVEDRAAAALAGRDWARAEIDGARILVKGAAPDAGARLAALEDLAALGGVTRLVDLLSVAEQAPAAALGPPRIVALREPAGVTLTGEAPAPPEGAAPDAPRDLTAWRTALPADARVTDAALPVAEPGGPAWRAARDFAAQALASLDRGRAEIAPGRVRLETSAPSAEAAARLERRLRAALPGGVALVLDVDAPPPAFSPFAFIAARGADGATLLRCHAQSEDEAAEILRAFSSLPQAEAASRGCEVGVGAPSARWGEAVRAGLEAVAVLPAGRFELADNEARLIGLPPTPPERFETAAKALGSALGESFSLVVEPPAGSAAAPPSGGVPAASERGGAETPAATGATPEPVRIWAAIGKEGGDLAVTGAAPDEATRLAVSSYAKALFGAASVSESLELSADPPPPGWRRAALAGLEALSALEDGEMTYDGRIVEVRGRAEDPAAVAELRAALEAAPGGLDATRSAVEIDLAARAARLPLGPEDCLARLKEVVEADPIIFPPASAEIVPGSGPTLDALAAALLRCAGLEVVVEGHTDSQGAEGSNLLLSQARAEAVLDALFARGVSLAKMTAKGYGESRPVAGNGTDAGRALNRRIAFSAVAPEGEGGTPGEEDADR